MNPAPAYSPADLVILTAANEAYAGCLGQLLRNLERRRLARAHRVVVCDLGLAPLRRAALEQRFPWAEFRRFDFAQRPPHVALDRRTFAWKPIAIADLADETGLPVLWLDSATFVRALLDDVHRALAGDGLYLLRGQAALRERCDPSVSRALGATPPQLDEREFVAGAIGFDPRRDPIRALLHAWRRCALDPTLQLPRTSAHLPEQAVLSVLVQQGLAARRLRVAPADVDISCAVPARWISTRHKVPAWLPPWAGPPTHLFYRAVKTVDQLWHRWRRFKATRINGLHRWPKEHFQIYLQDGRQTPPVAVPAPRWSYYADPFLWRHEGRAWLFAEEFRYLEHAARLVALPLDAELRAGPPQPLELAGGREGHRSFPFLFTAQDQVFLLPESSALRAVDLYVSEEFPRRWRWVRRLIDGVDAADSALLPHAGRWWLFTSVRPQEHAPRALEIHHTDDLLGGRWEPHPINAERRFADAPFSSGRCAGPFVRTPDGAWLRPVQSSRNYYGEGLRFLRIDVLSPTEFQESACAADHPLAALAARVAPHHLAQDGDRIAFDVRTRVRYGQLRARRPVGANYGTE